jgi:predicted RNA-binding Zn ribbon-like protein
VEAQAILMLRVSWEWIGFEEALDVANTVAVSNGVEHDLLAPAGEYERWAQAAATSPALDPEQAGALLEAREQVLALREPIRRLLAATAAGERPPEPAVAALNRVSRASPTWLELGSDRNAHELAQGSAVDRRLATSARSASRLAADGSTRLRVCPAPSCGMFHRPRRERQHWCSRQCGTRARVARHYRRRPHRDAA